MAVTIWGAGAIGGLVGAWLARRGVDVLLVDQNEAHVRAMQTSGLFIDGLRGEFRVPVRAALPAEVQEPLDLVFLAVKCLHTETALRQMMPHLAPDSTVVSLQNGLNEELIAELIGAQRTVGSFIGFATDWQAPGHIRHSAEHPLYIGELDGRTTERLSRIQHVLSHFYDTVITDNIWGYLWSKLAYASLMFGTALVDADVADIVVDPAAGPVLAGLVREVLTLATRQDIKLERLLEFWPEEFAGDDYQTGLARIAHHWRGQIKARTGMWRDLAVRHRRTEADCQIGVVLQRSLAVGLALPLNRRLLGLIHDVEAGRRPMTWDNLRAVSLRQA